jgi:hypothetical protein
MQVWMPRLRGFPEYDHEFSDGETATGITQSDRLADLLADIRGGSD